MFRRSVLALGMVAIALLALAAPVLAGGWAVITIDALPRDVRAGQSFQIGFMVRQHGKTPTNIDLNGKPLKPMVIAQKQGDSQTLQFAARQQGDTGHYVADISLPGAGTWEWSITAPTFYIETNGKSNGTAANFEPLTVLRSAAPAAAPADANPVPLQAEPGILGLTPMVLRWGGVLLLLAAGGIALLSRRGRVRSEPVARAQ